MAGGDDATGVAGVRLTHPDRVLYADQGITKRELAEYYAAVAERMLPHVRGRPLTLVRCPAGEQGECFYQRRAAKGTPRALGRVKVPVEGEDETYLVADSLAALTSLVQMGVLEVHVWGARRDRLDRPDRMVLDLDPAEGLPWTDVAAAAREARERLAAAGLECWVKTTGGKGLHVVAPLARRAGWEEVREFARGVAEAMMRDAPERYLASASKEERAGRTYVDYVRNSWSASAVAPYSTRSRPGAPVSFPLAWEALDGGAAPGDFTVRTVPGLVRSRPDPWAGMAEAAQGLTRAVWAKLRKG